MVTVGTQVKDTRTNHTFIIEEIFKPLETGVTIYKYKQDNKTRIINDKHLELGIFKVVK